MLKIPTYYFDGKKRGQIYHVQLNKNCSSLREHLFSKNIIDSPLGVCGAVEDTSHFLYNCHRFHNLRQNYLFATVTPICQLTSNILLYGSEHLTNNETQQVFLAVQNFLIKSKRFEIT